MKRRRMVREVNPQAERDAGYTNGGLYIGEVGLEAAQAYYATKEPSLRHEDRECILAYWAGYKQALVEAALAASWATGA